MCSRIFQADERGSASVEAAIVIPVAMLIVLFAIQACLWSHAATEVQNAAAGGAEAATGLGGSLPSGYDEAQNLLSQSSMVVIAPTVQVQGSLGGLVRITVSGTAESIVPGMSFPVSASRTGVIQEFRQSG